MGSGDQSFAQAPEKQNDVYNTQNDISISIFYLPPNQMKRFTDISEYDMSFLVTLS